MDGWMDEKEINFGIATPMDEWMKKKLIIWQMQQWMNVNMD